MNYLDLFSLKGKTAMVTGGAGILGQHFCKGLASAGANVAIVDINRGHAQKLADEVAQTYGVKAFAFDYDITQPSNVKELLREAKDIFGRIEVLHNNMAGKTNDLELFFAPYEKYDMETWNTIMNSNLNSMFLVSQAVGAHMQEEGIAGSIIQTSSIYGIMAPDSRIYEGSEYMGVTINTPAIYSVTKAGVIGLTRYLSTYWAKENIRVNSISPGGVESGQNETFKSKYSNRVPLGRMARASEMVGALLYLASEASSYMTGQNIVVDGGLSAW